VGRARTTRRITGAAGDLGVLAKGHGSPVGEGLKTSLVGFVIPAMIDAGAAHRRAIGKACCSGKCGREKDKASCRKKSAHGPYTHDDGQTGGALSRTLRLR
jgi:hypothetical protein